MNKDGVPRDAPDRRGREGANDMHTSVGGVPRRIRIDLMTPAERAIREVMLHVEGLGAHPHLTEAVGALEKARNHVADWVDADLKAKAREAIVD